MAGDELKFRVVIKSGESLMGEIEEESGVALLKIVVDFSMAPAMAGLRMFVLEAHQRGTLCRTAKEG